MRRYAFALLLCAGCGRSAPEVAPPKPQVARLLVQTSAWGDGARIPVKHASDGANFSPPLNWQGVPSDPQNGAKSLAIICRDETSRRCHWLIWNLPPGGSHLREALPRQGTLFNDAQQGINSFNRLGYSGPQASRARVYSFQVFALDRVLNLPSGSNEAALCDAMRGHVMAQGQIMGRYGG